MKCVPLGGAEPYCVAGTQPHTGPWRDRVVLTRRLGRIAPPDIAGDQREIEENAEQKQHQPGELESKIMGVGGHKQAEDAGTVLRWRR